MIWVCRPGQKGVYFQKFIKEERIFLCWEGFNIDLSQASTREDYRKFVINEKHPEAKTSVSNWAGQLYTFCREMKIDDYVLIPHASIRKLLFAKIIGDYEYNPDTELVHSRKIEIIKNGIPRDIFDQATKYSLGAYRTLFKMKNEDHVLEQISSWKEQ